MAGEIGTKKTTGGWMFHFLAIFIIIVWGASFPCTKILLGNGVTPTEIFVYRSLIAYLGLLAISRFKVKLWGWRDEGIAILCGITGGAIYFVAQNFALDLTLMSDVVIVVAINPLLTTLLAAIFLKEELFTWKVLVGSVIAFLGVALVTFRNGFVWGDGLLGNLLAIIAALAWSIYSVVLKGIQERHGTLHITRKLMIYGALAAMPVMLSFPCTPVNILTRADVALNILFLALVCSMAAFFGWNLVIKKIGAISASNYLYLEPVVSIVIGITILNEKVGAVAFIGCAMVLLGVIMVEKK